MGWRAGPGRGLQTRVDVLNDTVSMHAGAAAALPLPRCGKLPPRRPMTDDDNRKGHRDLMSRSDNLAEWLAASARGDEHAFSSLYRACSPQIYALLLRMLKRRDLAEEALQDAFVKIWQNADTYSPDRGAPLTWLMSIARYRALDLLRRRRPEVSISDESESAYYGVVDTQPQPDARNEEAEALRTLQNCLEELQDVQRQSVLMAYYEGYTHSELASRLKAPLGTVKSWVRRGLQRLRECLDQ